MYKLKTKQRISFLMALAMLFSFTSIKVFANDPVSSSQSVLTDEPVLNDESIPLNEEILTISINSNGTFAATNNASLPTNTLQIHATKEYAHIYTTNDSRYFQELQEGTFIEVQPVSGALKDDSTYQTMENLGLPAEVMSGIAEMAVLAKEGGNETAQVTVFLPLSTSSGDVAILSNPNTYPRSVTTWNGETFYHYVLYYTNLDTGGFQNLLVEEDTTRANLQGAMNLGITVGGIFVSVLGYVGLFTTVGSWLDAWHDNMNSEIVYCHAENYIQFRLTYNLYHKYTYWDYNSNEFFCCRTQRIHTTMLETTSRMFTGYGMEGDDITTYPNGILESENFADPEELAYSNRTGFFEEATGAILVEGVKKVTIDFSDLACIDWPSDWPAQPNEP